MTYCYRMSILSYQQPSNYELLFYQFIDGNISLIVSEDLIRSCF